MSIAKLAAFYLGVQIQETDTELIVSGPYGAMVPIIPKLKSLKFSYKPLRNNSWVKIKGPKDNEASLVKKLFPDKVPTITDQKELIKDFISKNKWERFKVFQNSLEELEISGETYPIKDIFSGLNAQWNTLLNSYRIPPHGITEKRLNLLQDGMEGVEREFRQRRETAEKFIAEWKYPKIVKVISDGQQMILAIKDMTFRNLDIKGVLPTAKKQMMGDWFVSFRNGKSLPQLASEIEKMQSALERQEQQREQRQRDQELKKLEEVQKGYKSFRRPYHPYKIGELLELSNGTVWVVIQLDGSRWEDAEDMLSFDMGLYKLMTRGDGKVYWATARPATPAELESSGITQKQEL